MFEENTATESFFLYTERPKLCKSVDEIFDQGKEMRKNDLRRLKRNKEANKQTSEQAGKQTSKQVSKQAPSSLLGY